MADKSLLDRAIDTAKSGKQYVNDKIKAGQDAVKDYLRPRKSIRDLQIDAAMEGEEYTKAPGKKKGGVVKPRGVGKALRGHGKGHMR